MIFSHLTGLESTDQFRTAANFLITGVSWYRIDHLTLAQDFFAKVAKIAPTQSSDNYRAQARLWLALISKRQNKHDLSQRYLGELMENHPRSREAAWVNSTSGAELALDMAKTELAITGGGKQPEKPSEKNQEAAPVSHAGTHESSPHSNAKAGDRQPAEAHAPAEGHHEEKHGH